MNSIDRLLRVFRAVRVSTPLASPLLTPAALEAIAQKYRDLQGNDLMKAVVEDDLSVDPGELDAIAADVRAMAASILQRQAT